MTIVEAQEMIPQNMVLWHTDCFEQRRLKGLRTKVFLFLLHSFPHPLHSFPKCNEGLSLKFSHQKKVYPEGMQWSLTAP